MDTKQILSELRFKAIRSSGPGGQHANKVSSKIELTFVLENSKGLTEKEKESISLKLRSKLTSKNTLVLQCEETRSQHQNKKLVLDRFWKLLSEGLQEVKPRKKSKPTRASIAKRLQRKKSQGMKKEQRKKPDL
jgi:ribosome-associated protein